MGEARKRGVTEAATNSATYSDAPSSPWPWTLPEDYTIERVGEKVPLCPYLVDLLRIDAEGAAREAHRLEDAGVLRSRPRCVALEELPPEYREPIETLMDAETAMRAVEDAVRAYQQGYRRLPSAELRDRLSRLAAKMTAVIGDLSDPKLSRVRVLAEKRAGLSTRRSAFRSPPTSSTRPRSLLEGLEAFREFVREGRDEAAAASTRKRGADTAFDALLCHLTWTFERFSRSTNPVDFFTRRLRFLETILDAATIERPTDLSHRLRGIPRDRFVAGKQPHKKTSK